MSLTYLYIGLVIALLNSSSESNSNEGKIVGGQKITINQVPSLVSVQYRKKLGGSFEHLCGGTLVKSKYVITSALCVDFKPRSTLQVRAGSSFTTKRGQTRELKKGPTLHPKYDEYSLDYDIAIIELKEEVSISTTNSLAPQIANISKIAEENLPSGALFYAAGWGVTKDKGASNPDKLLGVTVPYVQRADCKVHGEQITPRQICAGYKEGGKDVCQGDEGGPLYYKGELYGIVSFGDGCAKPDTPYIYTYILNPEIKAFIDETIKSS